MPLNTSTFNLWVAVVSYAVTLSSVATGATITFQTGVCTPSCAGVNVQNQQNPLRFENTFTNRFQDEHRTEDAYVAIDVLPVRLRAYASANASAFLDPRERPTFFEASAVGSFTLQYMDQITVFGNPGTTVDLELGADLNFQQEAVANNVFGNGGSASAQVQESVLFLTSGGQFGGIGSSAIEFSTACTTTGGCAGREIHPRQAVYIVLGLDGRFSFGVAGDLRGSASAYAKVQTAGGSISSAIADASHTNQAIIRVLTPGATFVSEGGGVYDAQESTTVPDARIRLSRS